MIETLILFAVSTAGLAISPGPDNIFVLTQSIVNGRKYGWAVVFGLMTGCIIHTTLVAFGISEVIKTNPGVLFTIKILGVSYLLYLAYIVYKSDEKIILSTDNIEKKSILQLYKTGFWMNVLNPKVTVFFLAFFPQFLFSETLATVYQFYVLGGLFIVVSFTIFSVIAILAGAVSNIIIKNKKTGFYLKWLQIIVFAGISIFILKS